MTPEKHLSLRIAGGAIAIMAGIAASVPSGALAVPQFRIEFFALDDAAHRTRGGQVFSTTWDDNNGRSYPQLPSGAVLGYGIQPIDDKWSGQSTWILQGEHITRLGLFDAEHIDATSASISGAIAYAAHDKVVGWSNRYTGLERPVGSAWYYDGAVTQRIGLYAESSLPNSAASYDYPAAMNSSGVVVGEWGSVDWRDRSNLNTWGWVFDGSGTRRVGLPFAQEAPNSLHGINRILALNERGQVIGETLAHWPSDVADRAWFFDGRTTIPIGVTDERHTGPHDERASRPVTLTNSGLVAGESTQYATPAWCPQGCDDVITGTTAWTYRDGVLRTVGLTGRDFTDESGVSDARIKMVTNSGFVAGVSRQFKPLNRQAVWIDDGQTTTRIDVPEFDETSPGWTDIVALSEDGRAFGVTSDGNGDGDSAWSYKNGVTRLLGLRGAPYVSSTGKFSHQVMEVVQGKYALGISALYADDEMVGDTSWIDDGQTTLPLEMVRPDDDPAWKRSSRIITSNSAGQLIGRSDRYRENEYEVRAWFYDRQIGIVSIDDERAELISPQGLTDDGWVYGNYVKRPAGGEPTGERRVFVWNRDNGFFDVGETALDESALEGIQLYSINAGDGRVFVGNVYTDAGSGYVFRATMVPEPEGARLIVILAGVTFLRARRERHDR